jgi:hypothetical protein
MANDAASRISTWFAEHEDEDGDFVRMLAGGRPVLYLGDCDPVDLLVFVWLRSQTPVSYIGVSDSLIERLDVQVEAWMTIPLAAAEKEAISLLTGLCPDYGEVIGPQCAALLARGRKLEIEAVIPGRYSLQGAIVEKDAP